ncbi:hypothetical protein CH338_04015 [Rhodoplanes elegans]|uniref:Uncharacterized protein n=1 Tax=Rhodoplanes elegans TaxID=29408 RepID=A0A327KS68_9BRAD|nr:hypothetical protein CH338_04015 [Rhodoplanes elegans]
MIAVGAGWPVSAAFFSRERPLTYTPRTPKRGPQYSERSPKALTAQVASAQQTAHSSVSSKA